MFIWTWINLVEAINNSIKPSLNIDLTQSLWWLQLNRNTGATMIWPDGRMTFAPENLCLQSNSLGDASRAKLGTTIWSTTTAPDGSVISSVMETSSFAIHQIGCAAIPTVNNGDLITCTAIVKSIGGRHVYIGSNSAATWPEEYCYYNLIDGTIGSYGTTCINPSITSLGDWFYRIKWSSKIIVNGVNPVVFILTAANFTWARAPTFTWDISKWVYVGNVQVQRGLTVTPYVQTTSSYYYWPRFEYDPITLQPLGLLIEEPRTNLLTYSLDISNSVWVKSSITTTLNTTDTLSPRGTYNAVKLVAGTSLSDTLYHNDMPITASNYIISYWIFKRGDHDWVRITTGDSTVFDTFRAWFNLATGVKGITNTTGAGVSLGSGMIPLGNGWYVCWHSGYVSAGFTQIRQYNFACDADGSATRVSNAVRYWAWWNLEQLTPSQYNASSGRALSYIPTGASAVTRAGDVVTMPIGSWFNHNEGTILQTIRTLYTNNDVNVRSVSVWFNNTTESWNHLLLAISYGGATVWSTNDSTNQANITRPALTPLVPSTIKYGYKTNNFAYVVNNGTVATDISGSIPTNLTTLKLGHRSAWNYLNGHCSRLKYYKKKLPNNRLQSLT